MPNFHIVKKITPSKSFRVEKIKSQFDLQTNDIVEKFTGNIDLPEKWNIGLIVGNSGTGKTTIAKELFPESYIIEFEYNGKSVIDDMPENKTVDEITSIFNKVGFNSPPSWLKPYKVLSNGEKMRVDLARAILGKNEIIVFDEFTSVVDRDVAKVMSYATQKAIRRLGKKFIAVSPHFDIIDWLLPDWIFYTNDMRFVDLTKKKKNRPKLNVRICEVKGNAKKRYWRLFNRYHYLNTKLNLNAKVWIMFVNDKIVGFASAIPFPHPKVKNVYREHRTVILPDWQGIGLGSFLSNTIAQHITKDLGKSFISTTSNPAFIFARKKSKCWKAMRITGRGENLKKENNIIKGKNRKAITFKYVC